MVRNVDPGLMQKVRRHGRAGALDVNACFQCGNCTAVCPLARDSAGFPRRVIRMAQVGMEQELLASADLWRCYSCGECTRTCPRQADPAEFMAAARSYAISRYDMTGLSSLLNRSVLGSIAVLAFLSAIFSGLLAYQQNLVSPDSPLFQFLPGWWIHNIGVAIFVVVGISAFTGMASMFVRYQRDQSHAGHQLRLAALPGAVVAAVSEVLMHRRFRDCDTDEPVPTSQPLHFRPWFVHASVMGGFLAMLIATTLDFLFKPIGSPAEPWSPIRLLGAAGGIVCLYGLTVMLVRRVRSTEVPWQKSAFSDWMFPALLAATVVTGLFTEVDVYLPMGTVGHAVFFTHVVLAMDLVALLPLSKFAHAIYRPLALVLFSWSHAPVAQQASADVQA